MTDALPSAQREAAALRIKQREDGIRAKGIQEGYAKARRELEAQIENTKAAHAASLQGAQQAYEHAASKAHKAGHAHGFWRGGTFIGALGLAIGLIAGALYTSAVIRPAFEAAGQFRMQDQVVRGIDRQVNPPEPDYRLRHQQEQQQAGARTP